ncbi:MAG: hypothetical protein D3918_02145 [Candidatus Electrothrix sp. AX2]|nr:hypothetical protein [Candidatus Electrothrix gigas]
MILVIASVWKQYSQTVGYQALLCGGKQQFLLIAVFSMQNPTDLLRRYAGSKLVNFLTFEILGNLLNIKIFE